MDDKDRNHPDRPPGHRNHNNHLHNPGAAPFMPAFNQNFAQPGFGVYPTMSMGAGMGHPQATYFNPFPGHNIPPNAQPANPNGGRHYAKPKSKLKIYCCNCHRHDHRLRQCIKCGEDGYMRGCPRCDTMDHQLEDCTSEKDRRLRDEKHFWLVSRYRRPMFPSRIDIRNRPYFGLPDVSRETEYPWTPEFAKSQSGLADGFQYSKIGSRDILPADPAWLNLPATTSFIYAGTFPISKSLVRFGGRKQQIPASGSMQVPPPPPPPPQDYISPSTMQMFLDSQFKTVTAITEINSQTTEKAISGLIQVSTKRKVIDDDLVFNEDELYPAKRYKSNLPSVSLTDEPSSLHSRLATASSSDTRPTTTSVIALGSKDSIEEERTHKVTPKPQDQTQVHNSGSPWGQFISRKMSIMNELVPIGDFDLDMAWFYIQTCFSTKAETWKAFELYRDQEHEKRAKWRCLAGICYLGHRRVNPVIGDGKDCFHCSGNERYCIQVKAHLHGSTAFRLVELIA